jgi:hypothetical protein
VAIRSFQAVNWTPTATADGSALANATYQAIRGASATQRVEVVEVLIAGLAPSASSPTILQLARSGTLAASPAALTAPQSDGPIDPTSGVAGATTFVAATTGPLRSSTLTDARLNLAINAFGGLVAWNSVTSAPWVIATATAPAGESSLSAYTGGTVGAVSSHILYEPK